MLRLVKNTIKQIVFIPLFIFSSAALSQIFNWSDAIQMDDFSGVFVIPEGYTKIGPNAFEDLYATHIILPDSITIIANEAFRNNIYLESINIPNSVYSIGDYAFAGTKALKSIVIPTSINNIQNYTFSDSGLENFNFHGGISSIGNAAFRNTNLVDIQLNNGVSIGSSAFYNIDSIEHLVIPDNTKINGNSTFSGMSNLKSMVIGSNVEGTSKLYTFNGTSSLKTLVSDTYLSKCNDSGSGFCPAADFVVARGGLNYLPENNGLSVVIWRNTTSGFSSTVKKAYYVPPLYSLAPNMAAEQNVFCENIDTDNDGHQDCYDQFPNDPDRWFDYGDESNNTSQPISNDSDGDGILDTFDADSGQNNCYEEQSAVGFTLDTDQDGIVNREDCDDDNDGLFDIYEPFFGTNPLIPDSDFDGTLDGLDAFPLDNTESLDTDSDGIGNNSDTDDDNDGYTDFLDAFPIDATEWEDSDLDGIGNNSDPDDDNDGVADADDAFPHTASESLDSDNDGVGDNVDAFPNDATEVVDTDLDGIGNNADPDDDNDGVADVDDGDPLNADIGIQPAQLVSVAGNPVGVNGHSTRISLSYDTSDGNNQLPGIGFRLHYSSEMLSFSGTENSIANDIIVDGDGPYQDDSDFDNDLNTDKYIIFGWAALNGDWPNSNLPASLVDVVFNVSWEAFDQASITTPINFSKVSTTEGYNFEATNYTLNVLPATWDFDGNGQADALTDGLILLRYLFGVSGSSLTDGVMSPNSTMIPSEVEVAVEKAQVIADVDGDGNVDALTDGLILLRYMFGLSAENLVDGVVSANAIRASAESVQQHIELYMPNNLLSPVQSEQNFIVGDWKLASMPEERGYWSGILGEWTTIMEYEGYTQSIFDTCVADDIYRFGENGTFEYLISGSTYMHDEINPLWVFENPNSYCTEPFAPWNEDQIYTYSIDENNSLLTVIGRGAYIALAHVANGTNDIYMPALAPESISYNFNKTSESQIILELDAFNEIFRFTLEKVVN